MQTPRSKQREAHNNVHPHVLRYRCLQKKSRPMSLYKVICSSSHKALVRRHVALLSSRQRRLFLFANTGSVERQEAELLRESTMIASKELNAPPHEVVEYTSGAVLFYQLT